MPDAAAMTGTRATPGARESLRPRKEAGGAAAPPSVAARDRAVVHPQPSNQESSEDEAPYAPHAVRRAYAQRYEQQRAKRSVKGARGDDGDDGDYDDDDDDDDDDDADERELLRERAEMKAAS
ncbi:hypothetical protein ATCC90586_011563 [Pythium insidiosum]|nr:hypothetical protein ATCC90586_011563 [Pythium insidiosum]